MGNILPTIMAMAMVLMIKENSVFLGRASKVQLMAEQGLLHSIGWDIFQIQTQCMRKFQ
jgi:hypothetical protein